jgi:hypothetical protein
MLTPAMTIKKHCRPEGLAVTTALLVVRQDASTAG